jgi:hypothetical protein
MHQTDSLPGNICNTIQYGARNKGIGVNANDSIDLFSSILKCSIPKVANDLQFIFVLIYTRTTYWRILNAIPLMCIYFAFIKTHSTPPN